MNTKILETLEFDEIKNRLDSFLVTAKGKEKLNSLIPADNKEDVAILLDRSKQLFSIVGGLGKLSVYFAIGDTPIDYLFESNLAVIS